MLGVVVVLSSVLILAAGSSVNYCGARMCGNTNAHTFCRYPEGPSPKCIGFIKARLNTVEKTRVLARLNSHRNVAAGGGIRGFPPARNMLKMRWVEELAREAQRWADQCRPPRQVEEHDACRDLYSLQVGQCVASVVGQEPLTRVETMVDAWYVQSMLYKGNVTYYVPPRKDGKYYGDFAQTLWAKSYMVGCARSRFMTHWHGRLQSVERLVCNIAPYGPQATRPLWRPGAPTSSCPPRSMQSLVWLRLCDYKRKHNEIISLDPSTTLEEYLLLNTVLEIEGNETLNYLGSLDEIYLTKLAIATMVNMFTTQGYFDSMQKKEIVEFVDVIEIHVNDSTIAFVPQVTTTENSRFVQNDRLTTANTTVSLQKEMTTKFTKTTQTKYARNRIKGSGINDMEYFPDFIEMTEFPDIKAIEDKHINKIKMDLHEGIETTKDNKMSYILLNDTEVRKPSEYIRETIQNMQICHNLVEGVCVDEVQSTTAVSEVPSTKDHNFTVAPKQLLEDVTDERHLTSRRYFGVFDIQMYDLLDDRSFSGSGDENIVVPKANSTTSTTTIDPETVRELQEALDRIEHDLDPTSYKRKERRDLRDDTLNELEATSREYAETPSNESESVDHIENILKRIPSWAKTTDERMNGASRVAPSLAIFLALQL